MQHSQALHQEVIKELKESAWQREQYFQAEITILREDIEKQRHHWIEENDVLKIEKNKAERNMVKVETQLQAMTKNYESLQESKKVIEIELAFLKSIVEKDKSELTNKDRIIDEWKHNYHHQEKFIVELK